MFSCGFFLSPQVYSHSIYFENFGKQVTLIKTQQDYREPETGRQVKVSNRLIVKSNKSVTKQSLAKYHPQIQQVTELFLGVEFNYFSVEIQDKASLHQIIPELQEKDVIELVQPDLLQVKFNSQLNVTGADSAPYLIGFNIHEGLPKTKGQGVRVAIIDDGFNLAHPDLQHITPTLSYDTGSRLLSSLPRAPIDSHGTKVAGIIFAAHNQIGIDGIAPQAELIALRQTDTWTSNTLLSFQLAQLAGADIINCSWHSPWLLQPIADVVDELALYGRNGKGTAVIFAAGNQGIEIKANSTESAIESAIVVGALDERAQPMKYSNYGPSVDLSAYGGKTSTTLISNDYGYFSGTSLATAIVTGWSALLLSDDPDMTLAGLLQRLNKISPTDQGLPGSHDEFE